jgi:hypothetical protein
MFDRDWDCEVQGEDQAKQAEAPSNQARYRSIPKRSDLGEGEVNSKDIWNRRVGLK